MTPPTTNRPTRATTAGRTYLDLQNLARRQGRPTDELHQLFALEGFLDRLTRSDYADQLVLKGGALLAAYDARRPTRDVDIAARDMPGTVAHISALIADIARIDLDDGLLFNADTATAEPIRDSDAYPGIRVSLTATLATAQIALHVDVNLGDPITPPPEPVTIPRLLGGTLTMTGYPLPMVLAEKIITAIERGTINTRWRDFADIHLLSTQNPINGNDLARAMTEVAAHRGVELLPLSRALDGYADLAQSRWAAWRRRQKLDDRLPVAFSDILAQIQIFADPVLNGQTADHTWNPSRQAWVD